MPSIFRLVLAVVIGIIISSMVIGLVDALNSVLFPSTILNPSIQEQSDLIRHSPIQEFLLVLIGYMISAFFGAYAAARIAPQDKKMISALFVGFFLLLCGIVYFIIIPQPWWLSISSGLSYMFFAYLGGRIATRE
jgi:archaellum biogenesis protein FlaJ (TadC family)